MSQVEWQQVKDLFYTALTRPDAERASFLDSACGENQALRSEIEVLLDSYLSDFLEDPLLADAKPRSPSPPLFEQGHAFSHYEIVRLLGRGGMGEVYLANDTALGRQTAIKIIHNESGFGDQAAARLLREARAAAKLDHPNICSVYEVGETDGSPFIAMQYVEGEILDSLIADGSIGFEDAVSFARQIAAALAKAHTFGIVHRDIKPSNVIVDARKHLTVLDFGLAKETLPDARLSQLSEAGLIAGTVTYMSPEHLRGQEVDEKTDIWSLGILFYQMVTGRLPFRGESKADLISAILNSAPEAPINVPPDQLKSVNHVFERALNKDPALRYPTIEAFDADLAKLATNEGIENLPTQRWALLRRPKVAWRYALAAILLLALAAGGVSIWRNQAAGSPSTPFLGQSDDEIQISSLYSLKREIGGAITDLSFSPDSSHVAFTLTGSDSSAVYSLPIAGGEPTRVSQGPAPEHSPVWSPDGTRVAYLSAGDGKTVIRAASPQGTESEVLESLDGAGEIYRLSKWSNDGGRIFLEASDGPKAIELHTGNISRIDTDSIAGRTTGFSLSQDESQFLTATFENGTSKFWLKSLDKNDAQPIPDPAAELPNWFPRGDAVVYGAEQNGSTQVFARGLGDTKPRQITFGSFSASDPVVSPDGHHIAYISNTDEANVFLMDTASRSERMLTRNVNMQLFPSFSPDAAKILYQTISEGSRLSSGVLKVDELATVGSIAKLTLEKRGCCAQWSPSGNAVAFIHGNDRERNIWISETGEGRSTQATTEGVVIPAYTTAPFDFHSQPFTWSPDGTRLAFVSGRSGQENVGLASSDGASQQMLTDFQDGSTRAISPMWSPDGNRIAFVEAIGPGSAAGAKHNRIAIYEAGTSEIAGDFDSRISLLGWSATGDGVFVAIVADGGCDVHFVRAGSSQTSSRIARLPYARGASIRLSPDQKWFAYSAREDGIDDLYVLPTSGGQPVPITSNNNPTLLYSGIRWSPDSRSLLYSKQTGGMVISLISQKKKGEQ
jgi:serine/threonine protein kinase